VTEPPHVINIICGLLHNANRNSHYTVLKTPAGNNVSLRVQQCFW